MSNNDEQAVLDCLGIPQGMKKLKAISIDADGVKELLKIFAAKSAEVRKLEQQRQEDLGFAETLNRHVMETALRNLSMKLQPFRNVFKQIEQEAVQAAMAEARAEQAERDKATGQAWALKGIGQNVGHRADNSDATWQKALPEPLQAVKMPVGAFEHGLTTTPKGA